MTLTKPPHIITDVQDDTLDEAIAALAAIGATVSAYGCDTEDKLMAAGRDAVVLLLYLARTPVPRRVIEALPACRHIARAGIGVDQVDLNAATEKGILVTNLPDYCIDEVATHAVALLLASARKITHLDRHVRGDRYDYLAAQPVFRLAGRTVGLVGFGRIGRSAARKLQGFDVTLLVCDPYVPVEVIREHGAKPTDLEALLRRSDYVCLFLPVTPDTYHLIGAKELALMKPTTYLINTSRGNLIDQKALVQALQDRRIAGAGLDVLEHEPPVQGDVLLTLDNVILTPHTAWYSEESVRDNRLQAVEEVVRVLSGQPPRHPVNKPKEVTNP